MMAAGQAAAEGARVLLLEKMEKPLRKLRITGKGRCNITNSKAWDEFAEHVFPDKRFFKAAFYNFPNTALMEFFERRGMPMVIERGDRVFPSSQDAFEVADVLTRRVQEQGVDIRCHAEVLRLVQAGRRIEAVECRINEDTTTFTAKAFIVATGGLSYPATGSTGDGYRMATETGHTVTKLHPSLSGLTMEKLNPLFNGITLRNIEIELWIDGGMVEKEFGEMTFNETGIEGPVVLRLSRMAIKALEQEQRVYVRLNMKPAVVPLQLRHRLYADLIELREYSIELLLRRYMPAEMVPGFAATTGIIAGRKITEMRQSAIDKMLNNLQQWRMNVVGYQGYERAVVTAGGVSLDDVDHKTMRSRHVENLSFAGELLDLDADTGGYNLQIAFSTGYLAGKMALKNEA